MDTTKNKEDIKSINSHIPTNLHTGLKEVCRKRNISFRQGLKDAITLFLNTELGYRKIIKVNPKVERDTEEIINIAVEKFKAELINDIDRNLKIKMVSK